MRLCSSIGLLFATLGLAGSVFLAGPSVAFAASLLLRADRSWLKFSA